ncbi:MAG TPA: T9SS type A sorting domain-containing protein [Rubricoccaceae bacterium]|jgi:hypothetical protein
MARFATVLLLVLLALPGASFAQTVTPTSIATGALSTKVFNNGILHGDCNTSPMPWLAFNNVEGGCGGGFLLGISATSVIGDAYLLTNATGWTPGATGPSTTFPYPTLTQGVQTAFSSATPAVSVVANHYWATNTPYVVHRYEITNSGTTALTNVYPGMFWDYDVAGTAAATNSASYTAAQQLISVWHAPTPAALYFGLTAIQGTVSGYRYDMPYQATATTPHVRSDLFTGLTVQQATTSPGRDQRGVLGVGPITIAPGATAVVSFASVGGTNQASLIANATAARTAAAPVAGEADPSVADGLSLGAATPNPASAQTTLAFELDAAQTVRLAVVDVLGREVAVFTDGMRAAGAHTATVDTAALPAGVYVARLTAGAQTVTRRFSVAH